MTRVIKVRFRNKNVALSAESPIADIFDQKNGLGSVPYNQEVSYFGWVMLMKPSEFLKLAAPLKEGKSVDFLVESLNAGLKIGSPFLSVRLNDEETKWMVSGHEGRNRCLAIQQLYGDVLIPVHILPKDGLRARDIQDKKGLPFVPERGSGSVVIKFDDSRH
jgi:hypothetical protein